VTREGEHCESIVLTIAGDIVGIVAMVDTAVDFVAVVDTLGIAAVVGTAVDFVASAVADTLGIAAAGNMAGTLDRLLAAYWPSFCRSDHPAHQAQHQDRAYTPPKLLQRLLDSEMLEEVHQ
jgi:hypothetical protein